MGKRGYNTEIDVFEKSGNWRRVADAARNTIHKDAGDGEPSDLWKKRMLLAEHSPIRLIRYLWRWVKIPSWVSVHMVRHKIGIEHFVRTQRTDRTGIDRNDEPQGVELEHMSEATIQSLIYMARKRLCTTASPETRFAFTKVKAKVETIDPVVASVLVPECIYRGFCPEYECCGYCNTPEYQERLREYRQGAKSQCN
jgi:hypothetical protein